MDRIVECVPNFSTADPIVIDQITSAIKTVPEVRLLDVDPDQDYNRVVITFVGSPKNVGNAAFIAISKASELIDMSKHTGEHPRLGATDVCPFIPVRDVSFDECVQISKELGKRVGEELGIPTYLYGMSATSDDRIKLSNIRKGEYEGFAEKVKLKEWSPDFGPAEFLPKTGAVVTGVRDFLIAFNINLDTLDVDLANEIAGIVRESGRWVQTDGERVRVPGLYKGIQAMGVTLERPNRKLTQVSMNVVSFKEQTSLHEIFEGVKKVASEKGVQVTGSEIVGLIPLDAILMAGTFYDSGLDDQDAIIQLVIDKLGLSDLEEFKPKKKIIELIISTNSLVNLTVDQFLSQLASDSPAPGGGSVSALGGSLAASLLTMVANLSQGEKYKEQSEKIRFILERSIPLKNELETLIDEDTAAFNQLMTAFRMPRDDSDKRSTAIQEATIGATDVPLKTAKKTMELFDLLKEIAKHGNKNAISDAGVGALFAAAAVKGSLYNVQINIMGIKDELTKQSYMEQVQEILEEVDPKMREVLKYVHDELSLS